MTDRDRQRRIARLEVECGIGPLARAQEILIDARRKYGVPSTAWPPEVFSLIGHPYPESLDLERLRKIVDG